MEIVDKLKKQAEENRVVILKTGVVVTALAAAYLLGKTKGSLIIDMHLASNPERKIVEPLKVR